MSGISTANGGTIHYRNYQGGVGYSIYVPANVNADTPIFTNIISSPILTNYNMYI